MPDSFDPLSAATLRRYARISLFVVKWLIRLLSASVEPFLRSNFGSRYVFMPLGACGLFLVCAAFNPHPAFSTVLFLLSLLGCIFFHYVQVIQRKRLSVAEPHSSSAGDSWNIWQTQGLTKTTVKRYVEPALCMAVGLLVSLPDRFLGCWLVASAVALFVKEQQSRFKIGRRIMDSIDAKHEAQALNNSLKQQQPAPGQGAQKSHRAHFPRSGQHPHP